MTKTILFMCPHGAAKSVMAKAYFEKLVKEKGLEFASDAAGPFPDEVTYPVISKLLAEEGLDVSTHKPRKVTTDDLNGSTRAISIGCDVRDLPATGIEVESWDDVPLVSENPEASWQKIRQHVEALVAELAQAD